jgi:hypothetical protein
MSCTLVSLCVCMCGERKTDGKRVSESRREKRELEMQSYWMVTKVITVLFFSCCTLWF